MLLCMKSCYHVNRQVYSGSRCHQLNYIYINHFALWVSRWDWKRSFNGKLENVSLICCKTNVEHCSLFMAHAIACINSINPKCWIYVKLFFSALLLYVQCSSMYHGCWMIFIIIHSLTKCSLFSFGQLFCS